MADEVIDLIHRLSYQVQDAELEKVGRELKDQTDRIDTLGNRMKRLQAIYDKAGASEVQTRERVKKLILETQGAIEKQSKAVEHTILNNTKLRTEMQKQIGIIGELEQRLNLLKIRRDRAFDVDSIKRYNAEIAKTQSQLDITRNAGLTPAQSRGGLGVFGVAAGSLIGGVVSSAIGSLKEFASDIVTTTAKYEKFRELLTNTLGGQAAGEKAFAMLTDFAAKTPFQLDELTGSYIKLINRGIKPTREELTAFGDIAASQGKSFDQFTEAILDATTGEFERMKEFGIRAKQLGNTVTLSFGNITKTVPKSAEAIKNALIQIRNEAPGLAGSMSVISGTIEGQLSNLGDAFDRLKNDIGTGFSSTIKSTISTISDLIGWFDKLVQVPVEEKIASEQAEFNGLILALTDANVGAAERSRIISELNHKYPELIKNIDLEWASQEKLLGFLNGVNLAYGEKIRLAGLAASTKEDEDKAIEASKRVADARKNISALFKQIGFDQPIVGTVTEEQLKGFLADARKLNEQRKKSGEISRDEEQSRYAISNTLKRTIDGYDNLVKKQYELAGSAQLARQEEAKTQEEIKKSNEERKKSLQLQKDDLTAQLEALKNANKGIDFSAINPSEAAVKNGLPFSGLRSNATATAIDQYRKLASQLADIEGQLTGLTNADPTTEKPTVGVAAAVLADAKLAKKAADFESSELRKYRAQLRKLSIDENIKDEETIRQNVEAQNKTELDALAAKETEFKRKFPALRSAIAAIAAAEGKKQDRDLLKDRKEFFRKLDEDLFSRELELGVQKANLIGEQFEKQTAVIDAELLKQQSDIKKSRDAQLKQLADDLNIGRFGEIVRDANGMALSSINQVTGFTEYQLKNPADKERYLKAQKAFNDDAASKQLLLDQQTNQKRKALALQYMDDVNEESKRANELLNIDLTESGTKEVQRLADQLARKKITYEKYEKEISEIISREESLRKSRELEDLENTARALQKVLTAGGLNDAKGVFQPLNEDDRKSLQNRIDQLNKQIADLQRQLAEAKGKDANQKQADAKKNGVVAYYEAISEAAVSAAQAVISAEQQILDAQISAQGRRVDAADKIAERGNAELLQREQERLDKLQEKREAAARQELALNEALTLSNSVLAVTKAAAEGGAFAPATIAATIAALVAGFLFVKTLTNDAPGFREGEIDIKGPGTTKSDSIWARLSKGESVIKADATAKYKPILEEIQAMRYNPVLPLTPNPMLQDSIFAAHAGRHGGGYDFRRLEKRLEGVEEAIGNIPQSSWSLDGNGIVAMTNKINLRNTRKGNL